MTLDRLAAAALTCAVLAGGCSFDASAGATAVSSDDVEAQIVEQFSKQFPVDSADCPQDLEGEVGATTVCRMESEGKPFEVTATVSRIEGTKVNFDLEVTKELGA